MPDLSLTKLPANYEQRNEYEIQGNKPHQSPEPRVWGKRNVQALNMIFSRSILYTRTRRIFPRFHFVLLQSHVFSLHNRMSLLVCHLM